MVRLGQSPRGLARYARLQTDDAGYPEYDQMTVAYPWTGRDVNAAVAVSGRAAIPGLPGGQGFNWPSMARTTGWTRPGLRGLGQDTVGFDTSSAAAGGAIDLGPSPLSGDFQLPAPTGFQFPQVSNLGLTVTDPQTGLQVPAADVGPGFPSITTSAATAAQGANTGASLLASITGSLIKAGSQIASYQLNPLYQKSTFYQTPQGTIFASNTAAPNVPGLTTTATGIAGFMPLLLLGGGVLVLVMVMSRR